VQRNINLICFNCKKWKCGFAMLPLLACGAGVYLGLHFNILVLLPFSALGMGLFIISSWETGPSLDSAGVLLFALISVQAGYMIGLTARESYGLDIG
jgi:hypothetical protein